MGKETDLHWLRIVTNTKYATRNPISRYLVQNFMRTLTRVVPNASYESVLEVGCGEGILLHTLRRQLAGKSVVALDIDAREIEAARHNAPFARCVLGSAYGLPFQDQAFDLVICCEVLEHLADPIGAVGELRRVCGRYLLVSVPNEPIWRVLNLARGAYIRSLGNSPGHVNHWSASTLRRLLSTNFQVCRLFKPLPWLVAVCRPGGSRPADP